MASESRLYKFSPETKTQLRKFRLGTSRKTEPQAVIYQIDRKTLEITQDDDGQVYSNIDDIKDELPDNMPRFILLSYPITTKTGRQSTPYVLISYTPETVASSEIQMLYAGARELFKSEAGASKIIEVRGTDELDEIEQELRGEE